MTTTIVKWGNSQGVRIPKPLLENIGLAENDAVELVLEQDRIVIKKADTKKRLTLAELFEGYTCAYAPQEVDWGEPRGKEAW